MTFTDKFAMVHGSSVGPPSEAPLQSHEPWLLTGNKDKPVYPLVVSMHAIHAAFQMLMFLGFLLFSCGLLACLVRVGSLGMGQLFYVFCQGPLLGSPVRKHVHANFYRTALHSLLFICAINPRRGCFVIVIIFFPCPLAFRTSRPCVHLKSASKLCSSCSADA